MKIDHYDIIDLIGSGGSADVYLGKNQQGELRALKVLRSHLSQQEEIKLRFSREKEFADMLRGPYFVRIDELALTDDRRPVLVMEYLQGQTLRELSPHIPSESRALATTVLLVEILFAIEIMHLKGLVHRDLKLENIFLLPNGQIKIADFGLSRDLESTLLTMTGPFMGSPAYMAPELIAGHTATAQSDLYGVGALAYTLATGKLPFEAPNLEALLTQISRTPPYPAEKINPLLPPKLVEILEKSLAKNVENRYQLASDFKSDLIRFFQQISKLPISQYVAKIANLNFNDLNIERELVINAIDSELKNKHPAKEMKLRHLTHLKILGDERHLRPNLWPKVVSSAIAVGIMIVIWLFVSFNHEEKDHLETKMDLVIPSPTPLEVKTTEVPKIIPTVAPKINSKIISTMPNPVKKEVDQEQISQGRLMVSVPPGVKVFVNGKIWTNVGEAIKTNAGPAEIIFVKDGSPSFVEKVDIKPNELTTINVN